MTDWSMKRDCFRNWSGVHSHSKDMEDRGSQLASLHRVLIAGESKDASVLVSQSIVWLHKREVSKLLLCAAPGSRIEEDGARACAENLHHGQVVNNSYGLNLFQWHNLYRTVTDVKSFPGK